MDIRQLVTDAGTGRGWTWATLFLAIALAASNVGDVSADPARVVSWAVMCAALVIAGIAAASIRLGVVRAGEERERARLAEDAAAYERGYPDRSK